MPLDRASASDERLALIHGADEPLATRDDLEGTVALLEELHGVDDRSRFAEQVA
jgi:hypothetical protein